MSLYNRSDIEKLSSLWDDKIKIIMQKRTDLNLVKESSLAEKKEILNICAKFLGSKKRKIYGGYAINSLLDDDKKFYGDEDVPDIDAYTPDPINDLIEICNILHTKKYPLVMGQEAQHIETYKLFVNGHNYVDLSYVSKNIYNKIQFIEKNNLTFTHPFFMSIDYFRMFCDPLISWWRLKDEKTQKMKAIERFFLLQSQFKYPINNNELKLKIKNNYHIDIAKNIVFDFIQNNKNIINVGFYGYNYALYESTIINNFDGGNREKKNNNNKNKNKKNNKNNKNDNIYKIIDIPFYEMISSNYRNDFFDLIKLLKNNIDIEKKITYTEFYPFFQFTDYSVEIYCDNELIVKMYNNNKKCYPYQKCKTIKFNKNKHEKIENSFVIIGSYQMLFMMNMINIVKMRVDENKDMMNNYYIVLSHYFNFREYFLETYNKTIFDNSFFEDFVVECIGETITEETKRCLMIAERKKQNKKLVFRYNPADKIQTFKNVYVFMNTSGNSINNPKNLKLSTLINDNVTFDDDNENNENNENNNDNDDNDDNNTDSI
jgi:hypothetical protein